MEYNKKVLLLNTKFHRSLVPAEPHEQSHGEQYKLVISYKEYKELIAEYAVLVESLGEPLGESHGEFPQELPEEFPQEPPRRESPEEPPQEFLPGSLIVPFYFNPKTDIFYQ